MPVETLIPVENGPRRVVITGMGAVSSIGVGLPEFAAGLRVGRSGADPITAFDTTGFAYAAGGEVTGFDSGQWIRNIPVEQMGTASRFAVAAARMATRDSGHEDDELGQRRGLVSVGSTNGESQDLDQLVAAELADGPEGLDPRLTGRSSAQRLALSIAGELELSTVDVHVIGTACAASNYTIGEGFDAIRGRDVEFALCGGTDAMCRKMFAGFYRLGLLTPDVCRPFDRNRRGILVSEGAGMLLLEGLDSALARGARIYAEVLGFGANCDARHPMSPDRDSVARCIRLALDNAGIAAREVDLICAHGTGTKLNDVTEIGAIRDVYGSAPPRTVSVKSMLGHPMGAAGALSAIACALAIDGGFIPPTINHRDTDPECDIDCVPNHSLAADLRVVQSNALAFGGSNAVLVLGRYEGKIR